MKKITKYLLIFIILFLFFNLLKLTWANISNSPKTLSYSALRLGRLKNMNCMKYFFED